MKKEAFTAKRHNMQPSEPLCLNFMIIMSLSPMHCAIAYNNICSSYYYAIKKAMWEEATSRRHKNKHVCIARQKEMLQMPKISSKRWRVHRIRVSLSELKKLKTRKLKDVSMFVFILYVFIVDFRSRHRIFMKMYNDWKLHTRFGVF